MNFQTDQQIDLIVHLFNPNLQTQFTDWSIDWFNCSFIYPELKILLNQKKNLYLYATRIVNTSASRPSIQIENQTQLNTVRRLDRCRSNLALINRAGGLYGRIPTEVVSTDRTQWGLYTRPRSRFSHTDRLSSVNKMFIIWQRRKL